MRKVICKEVRALDWKDEKAKFRFSFDFVPRDGCTTLVIDTATNDAYSVGEEYEMHILPVKKKAGKQ